MLKGLTVVEYATYIAAPGAGGILADWGARVIKVEPVGGDPIRRFFDTIGATADDNPVFDLDNRGKESIILDTAKPEALAALKKLAAGADVFLTNVRPGGLARAGLDPDSLRAANPRLVYASITGFGLEGPEADKAGFDVTAFWSRSGVARLTAPRGAEPFPIRTGMGDHTTSMACAAGILAALYERERTGVGRLVESSLARTAIYAMGSDMAIQLKLGRVASTRPREDAVNPLANFFKTGDDKWVCFVPRQGNTDWPNFARALGADHLLSDERFASSRARRENGKALIGALDAAFATRTLAELAPRLDAEDVTWAPVQTPAEACADPQLIAAGAFVEVASSSGSGSYKSPAAPIRFPGADDGPKGPAPRPGQHTRALLAELGYTSDEIDGFLGAGAAVAGA